MLLLISYISRFHRLIIVFLPAPNASMDPNQLVRSIASTCYVVERRPRTPKFRLRNRWPGPDQSPSEAILLARAVSRGWITLHDMLFPFHGSLYRLHGTIFAIFISAWD